MERNEQLKWHKQQQYWSGNEKVEASSSNPGTYGLYDQDEPSGGVSATPSGEVGGWGLSAQAAMAMEVSALPPRDTK